MRNRITTLHRIMAAGTAAGMLLAVTGCKGGDSGQSIKIMVMGQYDAQPFAFPETRKAAENVFDEVNKAGGINGKKIEVIVCNDKNDPNEAAKCAREAVSEKVAVVLPTFTNHGSTVTPVLEAAKIPMVKTDGLAREELNSPISFPLNGGSPTLFGSVGVAMAEQGCKRPSSINFEQGTTKLSLDAVAVGLRVAKGPKMTKQVAVGSGVPDYTPTVATIEANGTDCLAVVVPPADALKLAKTVQQSGSSLKLFSVNSVIGTDVVKAVNGAVPLYTTSDYPPLTDMSHPGMKKAVGDLEAGKLPVTAHAVRSWTAAQVVASVAKGIDGDVNAETMMDALNNAKAVDVGTLPPLDLTKPLGIEGFERVFNTAVFFAKADGGEMTLLPGQPSDESQVLKELSR
jgi:ABC-type branched-subunit amino acid transport system substrate-binding protein